MTANKLIALASALAFTTEAQAHPGHTHSQHFMERLLHALQTEWLAPLLVVVFIAITAYILKNSGTSR